MNLGIVLGIRKSKPAGCRNLASVLLLRDSLSIWDRGGCVKLNISEPVQDYRAGMLLSFVVTSYSSAQLRHFLALIAATFIPLIDGEYHTH